MQNQYLVASNLAKKLDVPFFIYANFLCYIHRTTKHGYIQFYFFLISFGFLLASSSRALHSSGSWLKL